jgi:hypothetical protein
VLRLFIYYKATVVAVIRRSSEAWQLLVAETKHPFMTTIIAPLSMALNSKFQKAYNIAKAARKRNLHFSAHDEIGANVIALDIQQRKLLYLKHAPKASSCLIIDLNDVQQCSVKKEYAGINAGELKTRKLQYFLKSILLHLRFKSNSHTVTLPFYKAETDNVHDIEQVEAKAKRWETIISKHKPLQIIKRA